MLIYLLYTAVFQMAENPLILDCRGETSRKTARGTLLLGRYLLSSSKFAMTIVESLWTFIKERAIIFDKI